MQFTNQTLLIIELIIPKSMDIVLKNYQMITLSLIIVH